MKFAGLVRVLFYDKMVSYERFVIVINIPFLHLNSVLCLTCVFPMYGWEILSLVATFVA